jgi:hypothetical protein
MYWAIHCLSASAVRMHAAFRLCLPTSRVGESATRQMHANFLAVSVRGVALLRILVVSRHRVALLFRNLQPAMLVLADPTNSECLSGATIQQIQPINQSINQSRAVVVEIKLSSCAYLFELL